jgi:SAM-dependent methyltransferase
MDRRDQRAPGRSHHAVRHLSVPPRLEWTRQPGTGPDISILGTLTGRTVIEVGCGSGHNLAHLAAVRGAACTGIDRDPVQISRARNRYGHLSGLAFLLGDAAACLNSLPPASADVCLSIFGAFSFSPPGPLLEAAARALRPGGLLALTLRASDHHDTVVILARR